MNPDYKDSDFEEYNEYMEYIKLSIVEESCKKFTMNEYKPTTDEIEITYVSKNNGISVDDSNINKWSFYYRIKAPSIHPTLYIPDPKIDKTLGIIKKASFDEWKRMKLVNERIEKINSLGI